MKNIIAPIATLSTIAIIITLLTCAGCLGTPAAEIKPSIASSPTGQNTAAPVVTETKAIPTPVLL